MLQAAPLVQIITDPTTEAAFAAGKAQCTPALESQAVCHNYQLGIQPTAGYTGNQAGCLAGNPHDSFGVWAPNGSVIEHTQGWLFHNGCPAGVIVYVKMDDGTYLKSGVVPSGPFGIALHDDPGIAMGGLPGPPPVLGAGYTLQVLVVCDPSTPNRVGDTECTSLTGSAANPTIGAGTVTYPTATGAPPSPMAPTSLLAGYGTVQVPITSINASGPAQVTAFVSSAKSNLMLGAISFDAHIQQLTADKVEIVASVSIVNGSNKGQSGSAILYLSLLNGTGGRYRVRMTEPMIPALHPGSETTASINQTLSTLQLPYGGYFVELQLYEALQTSPGSYSMTLVDKRSFFRSDVTLQPSLGPFGGPRISLSDAQDLLSDRVRVYEFYNASLDRYFYTSNEAEAAYLASTPATGEHWIGGFVADAVRTYREISPSVVPVCRFYGSVSPGPNSHFYTLGNTLGSECDGLQKLENATPPTEKRWNFEGISFAASRPTDTRTPGSATCGNQVPLVRAYNNGFARGKDGNHRYTTDGTVYQEMLNQGWIGEGIVMCLPPQYRIDPPQSL